ncbi:MAG: hybrid sensor histidine kinase/response regulator, partial [Butyrivibrio sp.]|nr:hybrid sensor histidine kinase/response regulator [Butyrivibrio sp.]
MYHCHILLYFIGHRQELFEPIRAAAPLTDFTHDFHESDVPEKSAASKADVIFADLSELDAASAVQALSAWKKQDAELILLTDREQLLLLTESFDNISDIWTLPVSADELNFRFLKWQQTYKMRKDYWQTSQFL